MKKIMMFIAAMAISLTAAAQNFEWTGPFGLPYVSVNGGTTSSLRANNFSEYFRDIRPTAGIEFGTYFTPVWGAEIEGQIDFGTAVQKDVLESNSTFVYDSGFVGQSSVLVNGKVNLSNLFGGYKGYPRRVEVVGFAGLGWGHDYGEPRVDPNYVVYNTGAELNVNLGKERAWQVNVRPAVVWKNYDNNPNFHRYDGYFRFAVGVTYKFGNRRTKSHNFVTNTYDAYQKDYDYLLKKYKELAGREPQVKEVEIVKEKVVKDTVSVSSNNSSIIYFELGEYAISERELARIDYFVSTIENRNATIKITGSADTKTGTEPRNKFLAEKRAEAVKEVLVNEYGFDANQIVTGVILDVFEIPSSSRVAIIE